MKFLSSKLALPIVSALAVVTLVSVQAIALSQAPTDEISIPAGAANNDTINSETPADVVADEPEPTATPIVIPTDGATALPTDDDEYEDEDEDDDEYEDEDEDEEEYEEYEDEDEDEEDDD